MTTANKHFVRSDTSKTAPGAGERDAISARGETGADAGHGAQVAVTSSRGWTVKALIAALLAAIIGAVVWADARPAVARGYRLRATALELASVDVATVSYRRCHAAAAGRIDGADRAGDVEVEVGGEVELVPLREGQDVREGEVLARIDTRNLQAQYDRQLAAVERARADLDLATLNRDKNRVLLDKHYISQNTYEATESAYAGMVASLSSPRRMHVSRRSASKTP